MICLKSSWFSQGKPWQYENWNMSRLNTHFVTASVTPLALHFDSVYYTLHILYTKLRSVILPPHSYTTVYSFQSLSLLISPTLSSTFFTGQHESIKFSLTILFVYLRYLGEDLARVSETNVLKIKLIIWLAIYFHFQVR